MIENILSLVIGSGIFAYLIKIEHRVSKIETYCKIKSPKCGDKKENEN